MIAKPYLVYSILQSSFESTSFATEQEARDYAAAKAASLPGYDFAVLSHLTSYTAGGAVEADTVVVA